MFADRLKIVEGWMVFAAERTFQEVVVFPFQFVSEPIAESQLPPPFLEGDPRLGYLNIDLFDPSSMG
jgi:hypothetical protein